ncbi:MAG TPA: anion transporter [Ignavibacteriaceae bacterium]
MTFYNSIILIIIILSLIGVAIGRYPKFRMNRATIALVGASALIIIGGISLEDAIASIDVNTIILLFSMMVLNINLRLCGFFNIITAKVLSIAKTPRQLLGLLIFSSGILSGLFLNDTIVLMFTPLLIEMLLYLRRNPVPYLVALATSANVGSAATIVGNPQNMIIGIDSKISFVEFVTNLSPVAIIGLCAIWLIIIIVYKNEFGKEKLNVERIPEYRVYKPLLIKSSVVLVIVLIGFNLGFHIALTALGGASLLLITRRIKPERVFTELDWGLLIFFTGLFIITDTLNSIFISNYYHLSESVVTGNEIADLSVIAVVISNLISNVPAVLILSPNIGLMTDPKTLWLTLAMASTFAGNLTLLGSVANLIVAETAKRRGVILKFNEYLKAGIPITIITLLIGILWMIFISS